MNESSRYKVRIFEDEFQNEVLDDKNLKFDKISYNYIQEQI